MSGVIQHWLGRRFMQVSGWRVEGQRPDSPRTIVIAAPHTSNWDFVYLLGAAAVFRMKIHWLGKKELFRPPFGWLMRAFGGIPVERSKSTALVEQIVVQLQEEGERHIVVPPSGTRSRTDHWRSGFYWMAHDAQVPVVCGFLDYRRKVAGLGLTFVPSGDVAADMAEVRDFYRPIVGKYPERASTVRLREE